jgi:prolyl-tRNA synthetase
MAKDKPNNQPPGKKETAAERRVKALALRKMRKSYREIGKALGVSYKTVERDVKAALADLTKASESEAEDLRALELASLDAAAAAIAKMVLAGNLAAIDRWLKLSESRRKLLGLDAAQEIKNIGNLSDAELIAGAARLFAGALPKGPDPPAKGG